MKTSLTHQCPPTHPTMYINVHKAEAGRETVPVHRIRSPGSTLPFVEAPSSPAVRTSYSVQADFGVDFGVAGQPDLGESEYQCDGPAWNKRAMQPEKRQLYRD